MTGERQECLFLPHSQPVRILNLIRPQKLFHRNIRRFSNRVHTVLFPHYINCHSIIPSPCYFSSISYMLKYRPILHFKPKKQTRSNKLPIRFPDHRAHMQPYSGPKKTPASVLAGVFFILSNRLKISRTVFA